jgi:hypothetical protein
MTRLLVFVISTGLSAATLAAAQEPLYPPLPKTSPTKGSHETLQQTKVMTDSGTKATSTDTLTGKVEAYEPGKSIKISTPGKIESDRTIELQGKDVTARVNSSIKKGSWVIVLTKTDENGHKTITLEPSKNPTDAR